MNTSNNLDSSSTPREILNEENFDIWAYELRTNLEISHIDKYIQFDADKELNKLYDKLKSEKEDKKDIENSISITKEKDSRARQQILCSVSKETKATLIGLRLKSAYEMYKYLESEYNNKYQQSSRFIRPFKKSKSQDGQRSNQIYYRIRTSL